MKKKEEISPPSKTGITDRKDLEDKVAEKRRQFASLAKELEVMEDELHYGDIYKEILPQAAQLALTNQKDLNLAYKENKGGLVQDFNYAIKNKKNARKHFTSASFFGLLTVGTAIGTIAVDPALLVFTMMTGVGSLFSLLDGVQSKDSQKHTIQRIQNQVATHHKQLPAPK
jgi:hypothetical protein